MTFEEFKKWKPDVPAFALFGDPVGHSVSPRLHTLLFDTDKFNGVFEAVCVSPEELPEAMLLAREKLCGLCCTIPHKKAVMPLLDEIQQRAQEIGAVNVVWFDRGRALGYNTDVDGFSGALELLQVPLRRKKVLLAGYGGAATVVAWLCRQNGAALTVTGRNREKGEAFAAGFGGKFALTEELGERYDIMVNATSVGMYPKEDEMPVPEAIVGLCSLAYDMVYNPPRTALLQAADRAHKRTESGLSMLVLQAAAAQVIWTGRQFSQEALRRVLKVMEADLAKKRLHDKWNKRNLVLIGFMGSGKSTVGRQLASDLGMQFVDLDAQIEKEAGKKISEIFAEKGEAHFRTLETEMAKKLADGTGYVISTGGGTAENEENIRALRQSGVVVYLRISPSIALFRLRNDKKRPMLQAPDRRKRVNALMKQRHPNYKQRCDIEINAGGSMETVRRRIYRMI